MAEPASKGKRNTKFIGVAVAGVVIIAVLIALFTLGSGGIQQSIQRTFPPDVQVTSQNARSGNIGLDYVQWVDVSVHNSGGAGTVTVWAKVTQGSSEWTKSQSVYLDAKGSQNLTFEFREVGLFDGGGSYSVWVTS